MDQFALVAEYSFLVTMLGMAAASAYFWMERDALEPELRRTGTLIGIYTAVAAFVYWRMVSMVGAEGDPVTVLSLPTHYRYIDWLVTTPLIVLTIFALFQLEDDWATIAAAFVADIAMIVFGYFAEISLRDPDSRGFVWIMFGLGCLAFAVLLWLIQRTLHGLVGKRPAHMLRAYARLRNFILFAWPIYPTCFVLALVVPGDDVKIARELIYNLADMFNKIGLGVVAMAVAREAGRDAGAHESMRRA
jgi:sensory rhodopsin